MIRVILDTLPGPTHHLGGLSSDNKSSQQHQHQKAYPKKAALDSLAKMEQQKKLGALQLVLPPQLRPDMETLATLGFDETTAPNTLYSASCSSAFMFMANRAHITSSIDASDGNVHITPANLLHHLHRRLEVQETTNTLEKLFFHPDFFTVHPPLPPHSLFADEGSANHIRLGEETQRGIHLFVYQSNGRTTREALEAIARTHHILDTSLFIEQNPEAVQQGVFHTDIVAFSHKTSLFVHELSFTDQKNVLQAAKELHQNVTKQPLHIVEVTNDTLPLDKAVNNYLFNSLLFGTNTPWTLFVSEECCKDPLAQNLMTSWLQESLLPLEEIEFCQVEEARKNGGGPLCLSLSFFATTKETEALNPLFIATDKHLEQLKKIVTTSYPETLTLEELRSETVIKNCIEIAREIRSLYGE